MVSNCNVGATTYTVCWVGTDRGAALAEGRYESGSLHNLSSYNFEPYSKDNSEYAVLCSLLRGSTGFFFFLALHGKTLGYKNFEF